MNICVRKPYKKFQGFKEKGTMGWSTASEYFTLFTEEIIKRR